MVQRALMKVEARCDADCDDMVAWDGKDKKGNAGGSEKQ